MGWTGLRSGRRRRRQALVAVVAVMVGAGGLLVPTFAVTAGQVGATSPVCSTGVSSSGTTLPTGLLTSGQCLLSPDGHFELIMQADGNLVLYNQNGEALWSTGTQTNPGAFLRLQANGYLGVLNANNTTQLFYATNSTGTPNPDLVLQDDGNLVLYANGSGGGAVSAVWTTGTGGSGATFSTCNQTSPSTLSVGSYLDAGACLLSPDHDYELIMQADGNLVLYFQSAADPLWASGTDVRGAYANLQTDGNLIVNSTRGLLWDAGSSARRSLLALQDDGNLVVYGLSGAGSTYAAWSTGTEGNRGDELTPGQTLTSGEYLVSPNGQYQLQMGPSGVLVLVLMEPYPNDASPNGTYQCPIWTAPAQAANTSSYVTTPVPGSYATLQTTGNFVVYPPTATNATYPDIWQAGTFGQSDADVKVQTDGNVVLYSTSGAAIWSTGSYQNRGTTWCTGEILQGSRSKSTDLTGSAENGSVFNPSSDNANQYITNLVGGSTFKLTMQTNCDLKLTNGTGKDEWSSGNTDTAAATSKYANCYAILLTNGQVQVVAPNWGSTGKVLWTSGKVATQPFTITSGTAIGPFYAFTPETTSTDGHFFIGNQAGNQIYPGKSHVLKYVLKAIKIVVKLAIKFG